MPPTDDERDGRPEAASRVSRRDLLKLAGASVALASAGCASPGEASDAKPTQPFDVEADVVVVGSGAAGATAAVFAAEAGSQVVLLEKALLFGGTTAKSGGVYWIPNNSFVREKGIEEPRESTLEAMCRYAYPQLFDPERGELRPSASRLRAAGDAVRQRTAGGGSAGEDGRRGFLSGREPVRARCPTTSIRPWRT